MTSFPPNQLLTRLLTILKNKNVDELKEFLESIALNALDEQKGKFESMVFDAAAQGILQERLRCTKIVEDLCSAGDLRSKLISAIKDETPEAKNVKTP